MSAIGNVGGAVEAEARLTAQLARAPVPVPQKLSALLRLAAGETAPLGPVADRAKAEAIKLFRAPETRAALTAAPETHRAAEGSDEGGGPGGLTSEPTKESIPCLVLWHALLCPMSWPVFDTV